MSIQALERAFEILNVIHKNEDPQRAADIAVQVELPRTTVIRMLDTLEQVGAVVRVAETSRFEIGPTMLQFGQPITPAPDLKQIARPTLERLARESGETAYLCTRSGRQVYYLDQVSSRHHIRLQEWTGTWFPAHTTSTGKIFLAYMPPTQLDTYLSHDLESFTSETITDPQEIRDYVQSIRQNGFGWTHGQTELGLVGVAAPIFDSNQAVIGAVSLGGPQFRFPQAGKEQETADLVVKAAQEISSRIDA